MKNLKDNLLIKGIPIKILVFIITSIISFSFLTFFIIGEYTQPYDYQLTYFVSNHTPDLIYNSMVYITYIGDYHILVPATIIVSILFLKINQIKSSLLFIFMMGAVVPASKIIKIIISRPRPSLNLISQGGYSFPSGHALSAFTFFIGLYIFSFEKIKYEHHILYLISLSILTLIVSFSRIILGVHYMTDLIGSFLLGGILIVFFSVLHQYITLNNVHD